MALHRLTSITIGVPDVAATAAYYEDFGLTPTRSGRFATADGGEQLLVASSARLRLVELGIRARNTGGLDPVAPRPRRRVEAGEQGPPPFAGSQPRPPVPGVIPAA